MTSQQTTPETPSPLQPEFLAADDMGKEARSILHCKIGRVIGRHGFTEADREDLTQELLIELVQCLPSYDPVKAKRSTFISRVLDSKVASLIRRQRAQRRNFQATTVSLDELTEEQIESDSCCRDSDSQRKRELSVDFDRAQKHLPQKIGAMLRALRVLPTSEVMSRFEISDERIRQLLRKQAPRFRDIDMHEYL